MSKKLHLHSSWDKWDGHIPLKRQFVHDDYSISPYQELFHMPVAFAYDRSKVERRGFSIGVQKKMFKASSKGLFIDGSGIGQSDL